MGRYAHHPSRQSIANAQADRLREKEEREQCNGIGIDNDEYG